MELVISNNKYDTFRGYALLIKRLRQFVLSLSIAACVPSLPVFSQKPDSIVFGKSGQVEIIVLKSQNSSEEEYRFYDERGFYCLSLFKEGGDFRRLENGELSRFFTINVEIDPVFVADTFSMGFVNLMKTYNDTTYNSRFDRTIDYYYYYPDGSTAKPDHVIKFIDKHQKITGSSYYDELESALKDPGIIQLDIPPHKRLPRMPPQFVHSVKKQVLKGLTFSKREKAKNSNQLVFEIWVDNSGKVKSVELIADLKKDNFNKITSRISKGILPFNVAPVNHTLRLSAMKAAFYIAME